MNDERVVRLLARDKLANVIPLKMLAHHAGSIATTCLQDDLSEGALIVLPTSAFLYDRRTYEDFVPLFEMNDYSRSEIEGFFANGAASFAVFDGETPVSVGLTFQNYEEVWEIDALRTMETALRQGLATKIVNAALGYLGRRSLLPRYGVADTNAPSQRLAERCGLEHFPTVTHYSSHT